jgi:hypothetical protein
MNHGTGWCDVQIDVLALGDGVELSSAHPPILNLRGMFHNEILQS